jgi:predicted alpha/beta superfamily hydrolase
MKQIIKTHILFYLFGIALSFSSCEKDIINPEQVKEFSIHSTNTGSDYTIWVVMPKGYNPVLKYESVYVLDAQAFYLKYDKIAKITEEQSSKYNKQNAIVVGISSKNNRERDFTPTATSDGGGGSENYTKFIELELIPKIQNEYSADTTAKSRVLIGHSYGGLLTCYFFTKHPNVFHNYLTLSPSLWYDNNLLFQYEKDTRASNSAINNLVFTGCGQLEEDIVLGAQEWNYRLSTVYTNCKHAYQKLKNRGHASSAEENAEKGLEFYYKNK